MAAAWPLTFSSVNTQPWRTRCPSSSSPLCTALPPAHFISQGCKSLAARLLPLCLHSTFCSGAFRCCWNINSNTALIINPGRRWTAQVTGLCLNQDTPQEPLCHCNPIFVSIGQLLREASYAPFFPLSIITGLTGKVVLEQKF